MSGLPYLERTYNGETVRILIDTGATLNYCTLKKFPTARRTKLDNPVRVETIHNEEQIEYCIRVELLSEQHIFHVVENLGKFDMIMGMGGLRKINANIDTSTFRLNYMKKKKLSVDPIDINYITGNNIQSDYKNIIDELIRNNNNDGTLSYNTNVIAARLIMSPFGPNSIHTRCLLAILSMVKSINY